MRKRHLSIAIEPVQATDHVIRLAWPLNSATPGSHSGAVMPGYQCGRGP